MKYLFFAFLMASTPLCFAQNISIKQLKKDVYFLAADDLKGRGTGSEGNNLAANYIAKKFKSLKLKPLGKDHSYFQNFTATVRKVKVVDSLRPAKNIIGFLDNGAAKTIIIGAHYDHLGEGKQGSSKDSLGYGKIHNGADDNASGVAGMLALASYYTKNKIKENYNFLFIAFGAEELGLLGSRYYIENALIPMNDVECMINYDMIGRYNVQIGLSVIGFGTAKEWPEIFDQSKTPLKYNKKYGGKGGSDQTYFYLAGKPVLFFHTEGHEDYHMPTDDAHKVNYTDLKHIVQLTAQVINKVLLYPQLHFQKSE